MAKKDLQFKVIPSENREDFEKQVAEALNAGWNLGGFAIWTLSASSDHWKYFQTVYK